MSKIKIFLPLIILIFAVGCGSVKQADSVASEFYDFIKEEKFVEACGLVDTQALACEVFSADAVILHLPDSHSMPSFVQ